MTSISEHPADTIVILGTGGTIAGASAVAGATPAVRGSPQRSDSSVAASAGAGAWTGEDAGDAAAAAIVSGAA